MSGHVIMAVTYTVFAGVVLGLLLSGDYLSGARIGGVFLLGQALGFTFLAWLEKKVGP